MIRLSWNELFEISAQNHQPTALIKIPKQTVKLKIDLDVGWVERSDTQPTALMPPAQYLSFSGVMATVFMFVKWVAQVF